MSPRESLSCEAQISPRDSKFSLDNCVFVTESKADALHLNCAHPGDLVFTQRGTLGQVGLIPNGTPYSRFLISQSQMKMVVDRSKADPLYIYHYFRLPSTVAYIENHALQAGVLHINLGILRRFEIICPPLVTQQKIAAILSAYDDLIANNQRRITLLERMTEDIYREWFVRLRFPGHEQVKIEKGVPLGWVQRRFGEFCVLKRGYDLPDSSIEPGPYPVIASTSIKAHHKFFKTLPPVITTGRSGSLGDVLYVNAKAWPLNTALYVKDFCHNSPFLIFYTLKNMGLETFNAGAGVPSLNRNHLNGISIAVPPPGIQTAFDAKLSPIFKLKEGLEKQVELLKTTRDALLPRLISGKLAVDGLDIRFPPGMSPADLVVRYVFHSCLRTFNRARGPFSSYFEGFFAWKPKFNS
ncbi:restriction endonuclease subunit S [Polaromonas sp. P1(28)-13]|nr:restriction endonuclease subunit S [Polaromonas sp. P1(28)-13]